MKTNISMQDDLYDRVNEFCKRRHMSRSGLISQAVQQYMDAVEQIPSLQSQLDELKNVLARIEEQAQ
jgi:metal-responsive CopG/Arc/MetJ family transcriptional regulator